MNTIKYSKDFLFRVVLRCLTGPWTTVSLKGQTERVGSTQLTFQRRFDENISQVQQLCVCVCVAVSLTALIFCFSSVQVVSWL